LGILSTQSSTVTRAIRRSAKLFRKHFAFGEYGMSGRRRQ
jgi:hypothetical protein